MPAENEKQPAPSYDVFISYRREGGDTTALFLREKLMQCGLHVFLDVTELHTGRFDDALLQHIADTPNFLVILSVGALERCQQKDDWLRKEIAQAIATDRNIIPVFMRGFVMPESLPEDIRDMPRHQGVEYSHKYHEAMISEIVQNIQTHRGTKRREEPREIQERVLDAAIAKEVPVFKPTELTAMIRRKDSAGLKAVLEVERSDAGPEDVRSRPFELEFPVDAEGRLGAAEVTLRVESPDFEPRTQAKKLRVPPRADSETYSFLLMPKFTGDLRLNLELCKGDMCMASRVLRTNGTTSDRASTEQVLVSMAMSVKSVATGAVTQIPEAATAMRETAALRREVPRPTRSVESAGGVNATAKGATAHSWLDRKRASRGSACELSSASPRAEGQWSG